MKRYVVGVSSRYFFLRDGDESKDICAFQVGDYVKIKALFMPECSAYIEEIVITKNRTFLMLSSKTKDSAGAIPVDLIEHMEVLEEGKCQADTMKWLSGSRNASRAWKELMAILQP